MWLNKQECLILACIRDNKFGVWENGELTDQGEPVEDVSVRIQERRFIEALREHGSFQELKFADGLPMYMIVPAGSPTGRVSKQIRYDQP